MLCILIFLVFLLSVFILFLVFLPFLVPAKLENRIATLTYNGNIPRILFRTTETLDTNFLHNRDCNDDWLCLNPNYSMIWFTGKDRQTFIKTYCPESVYEAYNTLLPGAYKADLWRLCVLYLQGGVYVDAYATPYVPLDYMLEGCLSEKDSFVSVLDSTPYQAIHNGFIACSIHHPFVKKTIENIVQNVKTRSYGSNALDITGPSTLSKAVCEITKNSKHQLGWNYNDSFSYYLYRHESGGQQNIYKDKLKILSKYFSYLYYWYHKNFKNGYAKLWGERKVYLA